MKTIKDLTPEIKAMIPIYKEKAVKDLYNGKESENWNRKNTVGYVEYVYNIAKQPEKPVVIIADNLIQYRQFYNLLFNPKLNKKSTELVNKVWFSKNKKPLLRSELDSELYSELGSELDSELRSEFFKIPKYHYLFLTSEYARIYLMWFKFIKDEFSLTTKKSKDLDWLYNNINESNIAKCFLCKRVVLVLRMPKKISFKNSILHSSESSAIQYDNQKIYFIEGVKITKDLFEKLQSKKYTMDDFTKESNEEIKSASIAYLQEVFGDEYVVDFFREYLREVETYVDKKDDVFLEKTTKGMNVGVYTLFKGVINKINIAYVRCYCPSSDRMFFLGVDPINSNVKDAIASLYRVPKKLEKEILEINRQGERFSTVFTEKGFELLEKLEQKDIEDLVPISGNEYFNLIKYEY